MLRASIYANISLRKVRGQFLGVKSVKFAKFFEKRPDL